MNRIINIALGLVAAAIVVAGGFLVYTFIRPEPSFVGSKLENDRLVWQQRVNDDPSNALSRANLGAAYLEMGDAAAAIRELQMAVSLEPGGYTYKAKLGEAFRSAGRLDEAINTFKEAMEDYPPGEKFLAAFQVAEIYLELGDTALAKDFVRQSIADNGTMWNAHYLLGQIYEREGNKSQARGEYQIAAKFNPSSELQAAIARVS